MWSHFRLFLMPVLITSSGGKCVVNGVDAIDLPCPRTVNKFTCALFIWYVKKIRLIKSVHGAQWEATFRLFSGRTNNFVGWKVFRKRSHCNRPAVPENSEQVHVRAFHLVSDKNSFNKFCSLCSVKSHFLMPVPITLSGGKCVSN